MVLSGYSLRKYLFEKWISGDTSATLLVSDAVGIGKSSIVREAVMDLARYWNLEFHEISDESPEFPEKPSVIFMSFNLLTTDIIDLRGVPKISGNTYYLVPSKLSRIFEFGFPLVVLFDDVSWVRNASVRSALFRIILNREFQGVRFHDKTFLVATANNNLKLEEPLRDRFEWVEVGNPSVVDWIGYMNEVYGSEWYRTVGAFLTAFPSALYWKPDQKHLSVFDSPRSWSLLSRRLYLLEKYRERLLEPKEILSIAKGFVSSESAGKFVAFLSTKLLSQDPEQYFKDIHKFETLDFSQKALLIESYFANVNNSSDALEGLMFLYDVSREYFVLAWSFLKPDIKQKVLSRLPNNILSEVAHIIRLSKELR